MKCSAVVFLLAQMMALIDKPLFVKAFRHTRPSQRTTISNQGSRRRNLPSAINNKIVDHPTNTRRVVLMCHNHYFLIMKPKGRLMGSKRSRDVKHFGRFQLQSYATGVMRIYNVKARKYIAIDKRGKAYATRTRSLDTFFKETKKLNSFHTYHSYFHRTVDEGGNKKWYLAIKKNGKLKRPSKTQASHNSIQFVTLDYRIFKSIHFRG